MDHRNDFFVLIKGIRNHVNGSSNDLDDFLPYYKEALLFKELNKILPDNEFTRKRFALIGRNLALTIFFSIHHMCEEAQILLRQILDLIYVVLYGANHILDLDLIDEGKFDQIGNVRTDINRKLSPDLRATINKLYRKLSNVVHGTIKDILSQIATVNEDWENPGRLGHWKHDFKETLELSACLCRSWLPKEYAKLDISVRADLERHFPRLKSYEKVT